MQKSLRENKCNLQMTIIYTKYEAENSAVWTIYVKYGPKIYWEVWKSMEFWNGKFDSGFRNPENTSNE